jgi:hypothetical protein
LKWFSTLELRIIGPTEVKDPGMGLVGTFIINA